MGGSVPVLGDSATWSLMTSKSHVRCSSVSGRDMPRAVETATRALPEAAFSKVPARPTDRDARHQDAITRVKGPHCRPNPIKRSRQLRARE